MLLQLFPVYLYILYIHYKTNLMSVLQIRLAEHYVYVQIFNLESNFNNAFDLSVNLLIKLSSKSKIQVSNNMHPPFQLISEIVLKEGSF